MNSRDMVWQVMIFMNEVGRNMLVYLGEVVFLIAVMGASVAVPVFFAATSS